LQLGTARQITSADAIDARPAKRKKKDTAKANVSGVDLDPDGSHSNTSVCKPAVNTSSGNGNGNNSPPPKRTLTRLPKDHRVGARVSANRGGRDWHGTVTGINAKGFYFVEFDEEIPSIAKSWLPRDLTVLDESWIEPPPP